MVTSGRTKNLSWYTAEGEWGRRYTYLAGHTLDRYMAKIAALTDVVRRKIRSREIIDDEEKVLDEALAAHE